MKLLKRLGCLMALVMFAGATAFGDDTTWFTTTIADNPEGVGGTWTLPSEGWSFTTVGILKTAIDGTDELKFKVADNNTKTLPGDIATISTTVKFTAMDIEDLPTSIDGAKGGLTIVEDSDGATSFYGIVGGQWTQLSTDSAAAAIENLVTATVSIRKNGDNAYVSYKVEKDQVVLLDVVDQTATLTGDQAATISTVSYKGNCELAALTGAASKSVFNLTLPEFDYAKATVKVNGETKAPKTEGGNVYEITSGHAGNVEITFAPIDANYFQKSGTESKTIMGDLTGDTPIPSTDFKDLEFAKIIAKRGETNFASLAEAVGSTLTDDITLVADTTETFEIGKAVTFVNAKNDVVVDGVITVIIGGELTIKGGCYDAELTGSGSLALEGGFFKMTQSVAQSYCSVGYFAHAQTGNYTAKVVEGTVIESTKDVPAMAVDPDVVQGKTDPAAYLAEPADNGLKRWQSYALGLGAEPAPTAKPNVTKVDAAEDAIELGFGAPGNPASGINVVLKANDTALTDGVLTLAAGTYTVDIVLVDGAKNETVVGTKTIGVQQPTVTSAEKADLKLVSVPYNGLTASGTMTVDDLINKANLNPGDELSIYDAAKKTYLSWKLIGGQWSPKNADVAGGDIEIPDATEQTVVPGQGLWLKTAAPSFFQFGEVLDSSEPITVALAAKEWTLLAPTAAFNPDTAVSGATDGDTIRVETVGGAPVDYIYKNKAWGYWKTTTTQKTILGKTVNVKNTAWESVSTITPTGSGVWYISASDDDKSITF